VLVVQIFNKAITKSYRENFDLLWEQAELFKPNYLKIKSMVVENKFYESTYWYVVLVPDQTYLGRSVVSLKRRDCGDLADLTTAELSDFLQLVKKLENAFRLALGATMFNWSCLMNLAYRNSPPEPHVHWHFRPRYDKAINFARLQFIDPNFGSHYQLGTEKIITDDVREKIIEEVKKYF